MYTVPAGAGGVAEYGCGLGLSGGGEGGVADYDQPGVVVGGSHQLMECGVVHMCQAEEVDGVLPGQLLQDHCLPQRWMSSQGLLRSFDHISSRL